MCYSLEASLAALAVGLGSAVAVWRVRREVAFAIAWISLVQAAEAAAYAFPNARGAVARVLILLLGTQLLAFSPRHPALRAAAVALAVAVTLAAACADVPPVETRCEETGAGCRMQWPFLGGRLGAWLAPALLAQYVLIGLLLFARRGESPVYGMLLLATAAALGLSAGLRRLDSAQAWPSPWCMFAAFSFPLVATVSA